MLWKAFRIFLAAAVFLAGSAFAEAGIPGSIYHVAPNGDDSRSKAQAANPSTPWRTLYNASQNAVPGDTIVVKDGVYSGSYDGAGDTLVRLRRSGTANAPIRFVSENRWGAVLDGNHTNRNLFYADTDVSYITIEGFEIRNASNSTINSSRSGNNVGFMFRGNWIHHHGSGRAVPCERAGSNGAAGFNPVGNTRHWVIENNLITSIGRLPGACELENHKYDHALYLGGRGHIIRNNILFDNNAGWDLMMSPNVEDGATFPTNQWGMIVVNNTFASYNPEYRRFGRGSMRGSGSGDAQPRNLLIMNNIFWDGRSGIDMHRVYPNTIVVNNITMADYINESYSSGDRDAAILSAGGTVSGNITNRTHSGIKNTDLGMVNPRHHDPAAKPSDFAPRADTQILIGRGKSAFSHSGLPTVYAPAVDFHGVPRPAGSAPELGALVAGN